MEQPSWMQLAQHLPQRLARLHVEAHRGFIEEQQFGTSADRHARTAPGASGRRTACRRAVGELLEREALDHRLRRRRDRVVARHLRDQLARAHDGRQRDFLHHDADAPARFDVLRVLAEQLGRAAIGTLQAEQQGDGGGFAGAIGAEQGEQLAAVHREIETVERGDLAEAFVRALEAGEGWLRHVFLPWAESCRCRRCRC